MSSPPSRTNDAPSAAIRLIDMGIQPFLVASSLLTVIAQRLVRNLCSSCKIEYTLPIRSAVHSTSRPEAAFKPEGCSNSPGDGSREGGLPLRIMEVTDPFASLS
ncbi:hypothetical protein MASR2M17_01810 [Aminivibrio sp.]